MKKRTTGSIAGIPRAEPNLKSRRQFLRGTIISAAGAVVAPAIAHGGSVNQEPPPSANNAAASTQRAESSRGKGQHTSPSLSYGVYAEYAADNNKLMLPGLNRRVFNKIEAQSGDDITLWDDGIITLQPGTYRLMGVSTITMQTGFAPPDFPSNNNYPGYSVVIPVSAENLGVAMLESAIAIGTPCTAGDLAPSVFDAIYTTKNEVDIEVIHQAGQDLNHEVYLSIYDVEGMTSPYHVVARVTITRMDMPSHLPRVRRHR